MNFLSTFLTKRLAIPQQLYKTASRGLSAIAELLVIFHCYFCCSFVDVCHTENNKLIYLVNTFKIHTSRLDI